MMDESPRRSVVLGRERQWKKKEEMIAHMSPKGKALNAFVQDSLPYIMAALRLYERRTTRKTRLQRLAQQVSGKKDLAFRRGDQWESGGGLSAFTIRSNHAEIKIKSYDDMAENVALIFIRCSYPEVLEGFLQVAFPQMELQQYDDALGKIALP